MRDQIIRILQSKIHTAQIADDIAPHVVNAEVVADEIIALYSAPPKPAPDALREARRNQLDILHRYRTGSYSLAETALDDILALSAPVPSPDGAGEKYDGAAIRATSQRLLAKQFPHSAERLIASHSPRMAAQGERDPSVMPDCRSAETADGAVTFAQHFDRDIGTGAVEPVAWRFWDGVSWQLVDYKPNLAAWRKVEPLYAAPLVRGDRERAWFQSDLCSGDRCEVLEGDAFNNRVIARAESAADALKIVEAHNRPPVQPGAGEGERSG